MAQFNTGNNSFQTHNRTLFEVNQIALSNGHQVDVNNRFPVDTGNVNAIIIGDPPVANPDAFGRARVSEPFTLGDYKHLFALDPNFLDYIIDGASVTFNQNESCATLATTSNSQALAIHQSKFYHHYQPGKSQLIFSSVNFGYPERNVTKRTGYFDDRDGIYFEQVGSNIANGSVANSITQTLNFVIRSYTSNTASESDINTTINGSAYTYKRRVSQTDWNIDKCDGTGASGFNLDISKTHLVYIDFQWLGVGRVRVGFVHNGKIIVAHEYYHSNVLDTVYMANPNLPVRCEIRNTGTTPGGSFKQICATVASEGGYVESGIDFAVTSDARTTPTPAANTLPLIAIRLKNSFNGYPNRISVRPNNISFYAETNSIQYDLVKFPSASSLSGSLTWTSVANNSGVEYCVNATGYTVADIDRLASGFVPAGSSQNSLSPVQTGNLTNAKKNVIVQNYDSSNSEVYAVLVKTITTTGQATATVGAAIQWREIY
jgi:hypothetical protein